MATNITEEASRLRASAASSIIQNELELKAIQRLADFKIESDTSEKLSDNEFKRLVAIGERNGKLLQEARSTTPLVCSAIAASIFPSNAAGKITPIIDKLDFANGFLKEAESELSKFKDATDLVEQKRILGTVQDKITKNTLVELKSVLDQLHVLLFGEKTD